MPTMSGMSAASGTRGRTSQKGAEETRRPKTPRKRWVGLGLGLGFGLGVGVGLGLGLELGLGLGLELVLRLRLGLWFEVRVSSPRRG